MGVLASIEDEIISVAQAALKDRVRGVASLPGNWTEILLTQAIQTAPAVYVAFLGGPADQSLPEIISGRWAVYAVTKHASGQAARRRGNTVAVGAYEIIETLIAHLNDHCVGDIGTLTLSGVENLFQDSLYRLGGTVYAATFKIQHGFPNALDVDSLAPFQTFHADIDLASTGGPPDAQTDLTLP